MEDSPEITLKSLCCTCLSNDRKLFQLCRVNNGVNNLYSLLSYDSEAYREGFFKDAASLYVCWECESLLRRLTRFRQQVCVAQRQLTCIAEGRNDVKLFKNSLSRLLCTHKSTYDCTLMSEGENIDNFVDCGPVIDIKIEDDDPDDIPLSELHYNYLSDSDNRADNNLHESRKDKKKRVKLKTNKQVSCSSKYKDYFASTQMSEEDMMECRKKMKMADGFAGAPFKCESCVEVFKSQVGLEKHKEAFHVEKDNHSPCPICLSYVLPEALSAHVSAHRTRHDCLLCDHRAYRSQDMRKHLKVHGINTVRRKKGEKKAALQADDGTKRRRNAVTLDQATPSGYPCAECNKYFENKNQRWKHVQRHHREGYKCPTCGKRFAFKNNLNRHEQVHSAPLPREQCASCHKLVRVDLVKAHARIHLQREQVSCVECGKSFVSRASYDHHLKYAQAHAGRDVLKHKCDVCDKGYRSRGELRDHVNYQHLARTQHQCPVCGKALATRRCITRHVRRAHHGLKEGPRDKVCQQCGKAFRDKKGLREHEFTHTGERPLACEVCGGTFRQSASLYTHRRRVHGVRAPRRALAVVAPAPAAREVEESNKAAE